MIVEVGPTIEALLGENGTYFITFISLLNQWIKILHISI